jgi:hypothetical protein
MNPATHKKVTEFALDLFIENGDGGLLAAHLDINRFKNAIVNGTTAEDKVTPSRLLNWHFYPANETTAQTERKLFRVFSLRPTSRWIVNKRQNVLLRTVPAGQSTRLFSTFGRVVHHIQDMNTPSHVLPIYHDHKIKDTFEHYLCANWSAISKELSAEKPGFSVILTTPPDGDFVDLYREAAKRLLFNLEPNGVLFPLPINAGLTVVSSEAFWIPYTREAVPAKVPFGVKGFGSFGPLGAYFGTGTSYRMDGISVSVSPAAFHKVAVFFVRGAIADTLRALQYLAQLLDK